MAGFWRAALAGLLALCLAPDVTLAQSTVVQVGSWQAGHAPMYVGLGSAQPTITDSGAASGGAAGAGLSELGITAQGTGTPPYAAQGSGPSGTNICDYDAPISNATGFHYLCFSPNAAGGGLILYGAGGGAAQLPLNLSINGVLFPLNGAFGIVTGTTPVSGGVSGDCLTNNAGVVGQQACGGGAGGNPTALAGPNAVNGIATTFLRSDGAPAIQKSSATQFGIVEVDNSTITATSGVIKTVATTLGGQSVSPGGSTTNQGTGGKLQLSTGTTTTNDCVKFDSTGNTVDAGSGCGSSTPANPTATGGPVAVNGSAGTFLRSDGAPAIQLGTNAQKGLLQGDSATLSISSGVISLNLANANTWSAAQTLGSGDLILAGSGSGTTVVNAAAAAGSTIATLPANTGTVAELNLAQSFTGAQTFGNSNILLLGSSTGATTFTSANSGATNFTLTLPANTGTVAELNLAQSWSAAQTLGAGDLILAGSSSGTTILNAAAAAGSSTATFPSNTGTVAELNLAQTFTQIQTISLNTSPLPTAPAGTVFRIANADGASSFIVAEAFSTAAGVVSRRADGSAASPSAVLSGELIMNLAARGYGATGYGSAATASVVAAATQNYTDTAMGTSLQFRTTPNGTVSSAIAATLQQSGGMAIGTATDPGIGALLVNVALLNNSSVPAISTCGSSPPAATGGSNNNSGQFTLGTGSPTACTVTFANAYPTAAFCTVNPASNYTGTYNISAQSKTAFTLTLGSGTSSAVFNYTCGGN